MAIRWGILGAGLISHDFVLGLNTLPETDHKIVAVGARSSSSAEAFATKHAILRHYGSYDDLLSDKDVDVVYIGTIHPTHLAIALKVLEAGKPVLCEKPMTTNAHDTKTIIATILHL